MTRFAVYSYAWDLAEREPTSAIDELTGLGIDQITMAGSYHAGKFIRPRGKTGKVYFPEDGTVYFNADDAAFGALNPVPNSLLQERDVLGELCDDGRLAVNVWLVLTHNSLLGLANPELCVQNAFGDRLIYNLCPSNPAVRDYARGLAGSVTQGYPVAGISLETPGFLPFAHGYHHEFALIGQNVWLDAMLGLCFCPSCCERAERAGIDVALLRSRVARDIEEYIAGSVEYPQDMAEAFWLADVATDGELGAYLRFRCDVVTSLVAEIREAVREDAAVAVIPSVARPTGGAWYEGSNLEDLANAAGIVEACFYEPSAERVAADLADIRRRMRGNGSLRGILRPAPPDLATAAELSAAVRTLASAGLEMISFYNWGFLRPQALEAMGAAIAEVRK